MNDNFIHVQALYTQEHAYKIKRNEVETRLAHLLITRSTFSPMVWHIPADLVPEHQCVDVHFALLAHLDREIEQAQRELLYYEKRLELVRTALDESRSKKKEVA